MKTAHTKVFKSNQSQAVRLPKLVALPEAIKEVDITAIGDTRIITPAGRSWDSWFAQGVDSGCNLIHQFSIAVDKGGVTDDFMASREQPSEQQREDF